MLPLGVFALLSGSRVFRVFRVFTPLRGVMCMPDGVVGAEATPSVTICTPDLDEGVDDVDEGMDVDADEDEGMDVDADEDEEGAGVGILRAAETLP